MKIPRTTWGRVSLLGKIIDLRPSVLFVRLTEEDHNRLILISRNTVFHLLLLSLDRITMYSSG